MEFVRLGAPQYQKFDGSVVQNAKNGRTLSGADAPALPKGELLCIFRAAQIKLPLSGELLSEAKLRGSHKKAARLFLNRAAAVMQFSGHYQRFAVSLYRPS